MKLRVAGTHNVLNALAAIGAGIANGDVLEKLARGLCIFAGAERRFQSIGDAAGVTDKG